MEKSYRPEPITPQERLLDYWFAELFEAQRKTNELLEKIQLSLDSTKAKPVRKKKESEEK